MCATGASASSSRKTCRHPRCARAHCTSREAPRRRHSGRNRSRAGSLGATDSPRPIHRARPGPGPTPPRSQPLAVLPGRGRARREASDPHDSGAPRPLPLSACERDTPHQDAPCRHRPPVDATDPPLPRGARAGRAQAAGRRAAIARSRRGRCSCQPPRRSRRSRRIRLPQRARLPARRSGSRSSRQQSHGPRHHRAGKEPCPPGHGPDRW